MKTVSVAILMLATLGLPAQQVAHPPVCSRLAPAAPHPSAMEVLSTEEMAMSDATVLPAHEPVGNMAVLRYAVRDYAECTGSSGCYWTDLDAQTKRATSILEAAVKGSTAKTKLAMVFDIDETSLTNYCELASEDFGFQVERFGTWIMSPESAMPIEGSVRLAKRARELGVELFFVTGRGEAQRSATERNLRAAGYPEWKHLSLRPAGDKRTTVGYKSAERSAIVSEGYTLVLNMGDQWSDLNGTPMAQHSVKLPNPFYYLP
jgi:hypothetical protein